MRVIAGTLRGKKLKTLEGLAVRPTTDRVKEALFSIIQFDLIGGAFLDLFAGSGQNGIEAISRGASVAYLVDQNRQAIDVIADNVQSTGVGDRAKIIQSEARSFLMRTEVEFKVAFLDPPYHQGILPEILPILAKNMAKDGIIVCEHEKNEEIGESFCGLQLKKRYQYGKLMLSSFTICNNEEE